MKREGVLIVPPWVPYILALDLYVKGACAVWAVCALLLLVPPARQLASRVALSMLASFPGVFIFQVVAFPFCFLPLLVPVLLFSLLGSDSYVAGFSVVVGVLLATLLFALASLCGFWAGWSVAWDVSGGVDLYTAIRTHPLLGDLRSTLTRVSHNIRHRLLTLPSYEPEDV